MKTLGVLCAVFFAVAVAEVKKNDFQREFDYILYEFINNNIKEKEQELLRWQAEINHFEQTKSKAEQARIVSELEARILMLDGAGAVVDRELLRTDLDVFERYNFEVSKQLYLILARDFKKELARVKAIKAN